MSTFDSTKLSLESILRDICDGKIQLPDFQRGWVWDDDHIRDLLVSIARSFPVGAVMLLEAGGGVKFQTRPIEGLEDSARGVEPEKLILDGQQRLTTLTQALALTTLVKTRTNKGKKIQRHYYFDIKSALEAVHDLDAAIVAVDKTRQIRSNFGREVELDLSTRELECKQLYFPCDQIMNSNEWEESLHSIVPEQFSLYMKFRTQILESFRKYHLPVIQLQKETSKEAVCLVFEKVNTGGVQLSVFELITASYAAEGYNLRDDWLGSEQRGVQSRQERLAQDPLLGGVDAPEFLQAVTLAHTLERKRLEIKTGKTGKFVRPVSAKRADVLELPLNVWKGRADKLERGFTLAAKFLRKESFYQRLELPYSTQIIPLAATLAHLGDRWLEPKIHNKLTRWFWCGALGELYGGAVETRIANDYGELIDWFEKDEDVPRTVLDASFQTDRFDALRTRLSAAYKAINVLVLREGAQDWLWKAGIKELDLDGVALDIHHIFPRKWCKKQGIKQNSYDSILNKTPLSYKTNRKIGGDAPSVYLSRLQKERQVQLTDEEMNVLLASHTLNPGLLRTDDYEAFIEDRRRRLSQLIFNAMGKKISDFSEGGKHAQDDYEDS